MKWVTRECPKIDRLACPWLIRRFIDRDAEIHYVAATEVLAVAESEGAIPFDVPGVELTHSGPLCSFDAFLARYRLKDAGLARLADIVRAADTDTARSVARSPGPSGHFIGSRRQHQGRPATPRRRARHLRCAIYVVHFEQAGAS